jgi:hypothetical protein
MKQENDSNLQFSFFLKKIGLHHGSDFLGVGFWWWMQKFGMNLSTPIFLGEASKQILAKD